MSNIKVMLLEAIGLKIPPHIQEALKKTEQIEAEAGEEITEPLVFEEKD